MGNKKLLQEAVASSLAKNGNRWRAVLAVPGSGSSGNYSEKVLKEFGPRALAPGAKAFIDHDPKRPVEKMIGVYPDGAIYEDGVGLVGELEVFPHWKEFVETVGPHAGLSIYMMGEVDDDGNVTALHPDRQNGVDLVSYPGLEGSGLAEKLYESALEAGRNKTDAEASVQEKEKENMEKEILEALNTLSKNLEPVIAFIGESKQNKDAEVQAQVDETALKTAVTEAVSEYKEKSAVIDDANLFDSLAEPIREAALRGEDIAPLIESAKKVMDEVSKVTASKPGEKVRVGEAASEFDVSMIGTGF